MDKKTWIAVALSFAVLLGWQKFYLEPKAKQHTAIVQKAADKASTESSVVSGSKQEQKPTVVAPLQSRFGSASLGDDSYVLHSWSVKTSQPKANSSYSLDDLSQEQHQIQIAFDSSDFSYLKEAQGNWSNSGPEKKLSFEDSNIKIDRYYSVGENSSFFTLKIVADFKTKQPGHLFILLKQNAKKGDTEERDRGFIYWANKEPTFQPAKDSFNLRDIPSPVGWVGLASRYFLLAAIPEGGTSAKALLQPLSEGSGQIALVYPITSKHVEIPLKIFFGPKELDVLRNVEPTLDRAVDFGWLTLFAYPILRVMKWLYSLLGNYGIAIILLTVLVKIITYPLTYKSTKSMKEMAKLQPQIQKLKDKHGDDKETLNREMMILMRSGGYNPVAGCLPILIQMPIFFALYRVLYSAVELYQAPFAGWIADLSLKDPFYVTPVVLTLVMFIQQKLTPTTTADPAQQKMMMFMPLLFGGMMVTLPSGLTLYMLTNALASIVQQIILNKKFDTSKAVTPVVV